MPRVKLNKAKNTEHRFSDLVRGELVRQGKKRQELASYLGKTPQLIGQKLAGKVVWTLPEIAEVADFLDITFTIGERT